MGLFSRIQAHFQYDSVDSKLAALNALCQPQDNYGLRRDDADRFGAGADHTTSSESDPDDCCGGGSSRQDLWRDMGCSI